jgi:hypothetical protein
MIATHWARVGLGDVDDVAGSKVTKVGRHFGPVMGWFGLWAFNEV